MEVFLSVKTKSSFSYEDLILCGKGKLFKKGGPPLPAPPMLMFDKITKVSETGGNYDKGLLVAELNISPDLWFFDCHFKNDPVMPGCLGLDALWQLLGFYLGWLDGIGSGRAISVGSVKFSGQILPNNKNVTYKINIKRTLMRRLILGIADGEVYCDSKLVYEANDIRVGLFKSEEGQ